MSIVTTFSKTPISSGKDPVRWFWERLRKAARLGSVKICFGKLPFSLFLDKSMERTLLKFSKLADSPVHLFQVESDPKWNFDVRQTKLTHLADQVKVEWEAGILPVNLLKQKLKTRRFGRVTPTSPGKSPHKSLEANAKDFQQPKLGEITGNFTNKVKNPELLALTNVRRYNALNAVGAQTIPVQLHGERFMSHVDNTVLCVSVFMLALNEIKASLSVTKLVGVDCAME
nr:hypothetical protein Iba_chr14dCG18970 [Ipomoea batatas]